MAEKKKRKGPSYALIFGVAVGVFFVGASMAESSRRKRARGDLPGRRAAPPLLYDVTVDDLRDETFIADLGMGDAMRIRATANPDAGILWRASVGEVGPAGSPIAVKVRPEQVGDATVQNFQVTGVRPGIASLILTATDAQNRVVDSVHLHVEVLE